MNKRLVFSLSTAALLIGLIIFLRIFFFKNCQNAAPYNLILRAAAPFARITGRPCE